MPRHLLFLLVALVALAVPAQALATVGNPGDLDSSFDSDGIKTWHVNVDGGTSMTGYAAAMDSDGKTVVVGTGGRTYLGSNEAMIARFNRDGTLDTSFNSSSGYAILNLTAYGTSFTSVVIQPDGKIVVGGNQSGYPGSGFVARYRSDGKLDNTANSGSAAFGGSSGYVSIGTGYEGCSNGSDNVVGVGLQSNRIVAATSHWCYAGSSTGDKYWAYVWGLTNTGSSDGSTDTGFGSSGKRKITHSPVQADMASRMSMCPNGKILVTGSAFGTRTGSTLGSQSVFVEQLTSAGNEDTGYDSDGYLTTLSNQDYTASVACRSDNSTVVGTTVQNGSTYDANLKHFSDTGSADSSFGSSGTASIRWETSSGSYNRPKDIAALANNEVAVAGEVYAGGSSIRWGTAVLKAGGGIDGSYSGDGLTEDTIAGTPRGISVGPSQEIIETGTSSSDVAITRHFGPPVYDSAKNLGLPHGASNPLTGDPINALTGNVVNYNQDLLIPGRGLSLQWLRTYNSQDNTAGPLGYGWTFNYNASLAIDGSGNATFKDFDGAQRFFTATGGGAFTSPTGDPDTLSLSGGVYSLTRRNGVVWAFNSSGQLTSITDRNGNQISFSYTSGNLTSITDPAGRSLTLTWTSGRITQIADWASRTVSYGYDGSGNLTSFTDQAGKQITYAYNSDHNLTSYTTPGITGAPGSETDFSYDNIDRATQIIDSSSNTGKRTYQYLPAYGKTKITDSRAQVSIYKFDDKGLITSITDPYSNTIQYGYDSSGNRTSVIDQLGRETDYAFNSAGDPTEVQLPAVGGSRPTTDTTFDSYGNPTQITDPRGAATNLTYDSYGNLTELQQPAPTTGADRPTTDWTYNSHGQPLTKTDPRSKETDYSYDSNGYLSQVQLPEPTTGAGHPTTNYTNDSLGRVTAATDPLSRETDFVYDARDRVTQVTEPIAYTGETAPTLNYTYDPRGNRLTAVDENGQTTTNAYDRFNRVTSVTDPTSAQSQFAYDTEGNLTQVTDPAGVVTTNTYDYLQRLTKSVRADGGTGIETDYAYNAAGERTSVTDPRAHATAFAYDNDGRSRQSPTLTRTPPATAMTWPPT